ncbi:TAFII55 protein conserved region-domain-containing protein [Talaromyces proteolyticus]|uniref:TAFII55 protein conserved region-domain-containing protein n=1 Tax=Talaromyces proteolyticus TaxID=1131652 RepID=A0AAD4KNI9_9EURO|nr:TAFII55 protein conserved region-domain-containing protein [Talaromyces proteolyticus]KAH8692030.1 TAFII55 protein conserved region-domain-containing protein [Talaromyces proteolyticus]
MSAPTKLKISFGKKPEPAGPVEPVEPKEEPAPLQRKLTLKFGTGNNTPATKPEKKEKPKKTKAPAKPKRESAASKKRRANVAAGDDSDAAPEAPLGPKRIKLLNSAKETGVKSIRIRNKARVQARPMGVGYDSEASDMETDPHIEEDFILRMLPGEDCDHIRQAINERRLDRSQIGIKPLTREGRRTVLRVRDKQYAATLVDLPCIVEGLKSWDKRMFYKAGDITQMMLVLGQVQNEEEALKYPLPEEVKVLDDKTYQYAHGLTPPLKYARKRRFRKRVSARTIEQAEKEVADLIAQDEAAIRPPKFELVDATSMTRAEGMVNYDEDYDDMQDAYGEAEYDLQDEEDGQADLFEDELAADLEAALAAGLEEDPGVADTSAAAVPGQSVTPSATRPGDESSGDESEESDREESGGPDADMDDETLERRREVQEQREIITELEGLIAQETAKYEMQGNKILKQKIGKRVQQLKQDLALKKASIGGDEADGA